MAEKRDEEDVLRGVLPVQVGGQKRELPVRTRASAREWKKLLIGAVGGEGGVSSMNLDNVQDGSAVVLAVGDRMFDLVLAYDETGALGGREWLDANSTDPEIYAIFRRLLDVSFPFAKDLRTVIAELRALGLAELLATAKSVSPSSTNGRSGNGDSLLVASTET